MADKKRIIQESYARSLEQTNEKKLDEKIKLDQNENISSCCTKLPETSSDKSKIIVPSFGSTVNLAEKANLKSGEIVVDFGSGPGHDLCSAAKYVGNSGKVIGIDMTPEMITFASSLASKLSLNNVELKLGEIENVPLESNCADVVISNCVINLSADKQKVFNEAFRILKPGGRLVDSDKIADKDLPKSLQNDSTAWCGCIGGALTIQGYIEAIRNAGFIDIQVELETTNKMLWQGEEIIIHNGIIRAIKPNII